MKASYYPGCSLRGTGLEYGESAEAVCKALGAELVEIDDWNCCGASSGHSVDKKLAVELAARNLMLAEKSGLKDMVIPCSACYQRTKVAEHEVKEDPGSFPNVKYDGDLKVWDLLSFLSEEVGLDAIRSKIKKKLEGLKAVCYYGCLTMRHPSITGAKDYENPTSMEKLLTALGVEVIEWSYKTDCCGGGLVLTSPQVVLDLTGKIFTKAREVGTECLVTICPLCQGNLDQRQGDAGSKLKTKFDLPVFYITELIGLALGEKDTEKWLKRHLVDPVKLLRSKNLI
jgi:heterodisulfide reductase subunit B2